MNFFARQAESRRLSQRLVVMFTVAVLAVVAAVDLVVFSLLATVQNGGAGFALPSAEWLRTHQGTVALTTLTVIGVIGLASLYKTATLNGGGGVVARALGGVRIAPDTSDPELRRLLNVVEEMSIASGVPTPEVYLLEQEDGINAFAAGHNPSNAAVAVTRGALRRLNRAELQGVIAHEFSHILNGDMRLNVRLMGLLFGLLVIAIIARTVLRFAPRGRQTRKGTGAVAVIFLAAAAVLVIGYVGLFFGRLIQAAVSRSREALADSSAVQFTRDPNGLRGALVKIGAASSGSRIANPEGEEVAHMLFAPGMQRLFATHPPLLERLRALDPRFDPSEIEEARRKLLAEPAPSERAPAPSPHTASFTDGATAPAAVAALVGNPSTAHMQLARTLRLSLPPTITSAAQHPHSARALMFAMVLDAMPAAREQQRLFISQQLGSATIVQVDVLQNEVAALEAEQRLPAFLRLFPALRQLTREERMQLLSTLNGMVQRQGQLSLHCYVLRKLAQVHLRDEMDPAARLRSLPLNVVQQDIQALFSVLAQHGHEGDREARRAYEIGVHHLYPRERPAYRFQENWSALLDTALSRLDRLEPIGKEQLIEALVKTVTHDQRLTMGEGELLRAICATLHCPLPPLLNAHAA